MQKMETVNSARADNFCMSFAKTFGFVYTSHQKRGIRMVFFKIVLNVCVHLQRAVAIKCADCLYFC